MLPTQEKYILSLEQASKHLQTADHLAYITFPFIRENKLLLKVLEELNYASLNIINAILQYEYLYKRIQIYSDSKLNLETFKRISSRFLIPQENLNSILEIISLAEKHKKSPFEFAKNDKIVIMSEGMKTDYITLEKIKKYLLQVKEAHKKASNLIKNAI